MKTNKQRIEEKLNKEGFALGCWDKRLEKLNYYNIKKVIGNIPFGSTDIQVSYNKKKYIVEIFDIDNEYDFAMISKTAYLSIYDDEYDKKFDW